MKRCALCKREIEVDKYFSRKSVCRHCGKDLHICLNCRFYAETAHNKCLEPKAEFQRIREKANFCDYFAFGEGVIHSVPETDKDSVRKKFDDLFKK